MSLVGRILICSSSSYVKCRNPTIRLCNSQFGSIAEAAKSNLNHNEKLLNQRQNDNKVQDKTKNSNGNYRSQNKNRFFNIIEDGPGLKEFIESSLQPSTLQDMSIGLQNEPVPYLNKYSLGGRKRKVYFEVYGCQMNVNDTEVVWSILKNDGYEKTDSVYNADVILMVTCAIREGAEMKVWNKLKHFKALKDARSKNKTRTPLKIGVLDSYRDLPRLLALTENNQTAVNVLLSLDETYADVVPVRLNQDSVTAFIICLSWLQLYKRQNVNSYLDTSSVNYYGGLPEGAETHLAKGFRTVYKKKKGGLRFADLLDHVARVDPEMRIRFTSPHPKDFPDESGNSSVLERMRRGYTREAYLELIEHVREIIPEVNLSSDFICGFCGETEAEFEDTLSLMAKVKYNTAYLFAYSMREVSWNVANIYNTLYL
ncbi:CDK5 regulatory subunit-associated protein 1 [Blattella germanica]|nr:CDK5 regulatory subunit-associated protein 1 [Blattella germanica]